VRLILTVFFLFSFVSQAVADITGVSGTIANGETITIIGSNFGLNGPTVQIFDDFELGTNGSQLLLGTNSAQVGEWDGVNWTPTGSSFSTDYVVSGNLSAKWTNTVYSTGIYTNFPGNGTDKVFLSYWIYIPNGYTIPINWKPLWLQGDGTGDDDVVYSTLLGTGAGLTNGNETSWNAAGNISFSIGLWKRVWAYIEGTTTPTGTVKQWALSPSVVQQPTVTDAYIFAADSTPDTNYNFEVAVINGYFGSGDSGTPCYWDDVYVAYGDYAQARIEIGNNAKYADCTDLTVVTPTSWSDTSVTGVVRQGRFLAGTSAYLFVVDADGVMNTTGYPVTIGVTGSTTTSKISGAMH